jgi:hypothetical protein
MENNNMLDLSDVLNQLQPRELRPRLELQSTGSCYGVIWWTDCGCGIMNCCPYVTGASCGIP